MWEGGVCWWFSWLAPCRCLGLPCHWEPSRTWGQGGQGKGERTVWEKQISVPWTPWAIAQGRWGVRGRCLDYLKGQPAVLAWGANWLLGQKLFPGWHQVMVSQHAVALFCLACLCLLPLQHQVLEKAEKGFLQWQKWLTFLFLDPSSITHTCTSPSPLKNVSFWVGGMLVITGRRTSHGELKKHVIR